MAQEKEMAREWPHLRIDRRDLPLIVKVAAKNAKIKDFEITVLESDPDNIKVRIRKIGFGGRVETSTEWLES
jgi:hypothetical protein